MPNFWVMRPADARETVMAWDQALRRKSGPTLLALSRQDLVQLPSVMGCANGGYILAGEDPRDITLIATGSEVALALDAAAQLKGAGIRATVVSLPCWEIFETQSTTQRAAILGTGPKIGIEAAVRFGWDQILAPEDPFIGMTGFGASAKAPELFAHFGITTEAIVAAAKARLAR
jgi:transketolase